MLSQRRFTDTLIGAGIEHPETEQFEIGNELVPIYTLDDLRFSLPSGRGARLFWTGIPSTNAAHFSACEMIATVGCWIRSALIVAGGPNVIWKFSSAQTSELDAAVDAASTAQFIARDLSNFRTGPRLPSQLNPNFLTLGPQAGRKTAAGASGTFLPSGQNIVQTEPLWLNPGIRLDVQANVVNQTFTLVLELEFPMTEDS